MPRYARIKLTSSNIEQLDTLANQIREIAEKTGALPISSHKKK